jgi:hypothetical protein
MATLKNETRASQDETNHRIHKRDKRNGKRGLFGFFFVPKAFFNLAIKPAVLELEANGLCCRRRKTAGVANTYFTILARSFAPKSLPVSDLSLSRS